MTKKQDDTTFVALIGDIRGSRELDDREKAQEEFERVVDGLNDHVAEDAIASRFTVTTGDEFQALLTNASAAIEAAVVASDRFHPAKLRFGVGRGGLDTAVNPNRAIGMDGPCFHRAREAVDSAKRDATWLRVAGWPNDLDERVNSLFDLVGCVREDWTDRQAEFALALTEQDTQKSVADHYMVTKSTVSESLSAGHVHEVRSAEDSLAALLQDALPGGCER